MSNFDPDEFMNQQIDQPLAAERTICPEGEFRACIDDFTREAFDTIEFEYKKDNPARGVAKGDKGAFTKFNCPVVILDDAVKAKLGVEKVLVYHDCTLDFEPDGKTLSWGPNKNVPLGQLREATKQNNPGPWAPAMLRNAGPFMVKISHATGERKDGTKFKRAVISRFAPIL